MKSRLGFVSNSSSSSFICEFEPESWCDYAQLTPEQAANALVYLKLSDPDMVWGTGPFWLTMFVSEGIDYHDDLYGDPRAHPYREGRHGTPYTYSDYEEIANNVFIMKEHA